MRRAERPWFASDGLLDRQDSDDSHVQSRAEVRMASTGDLADLLLPVGTRLVHIGPSKTGTTSPQGSMWAARAEMRRQGVRYLGQSRHSGLAARAITGMSSPYADSGKPPAMRNWVAILREPRRAEEPRVVFSSEYLAHASRSAVEQVVGDMDPAPGPGCR
jgi:hypothetical protein